MAVKDLEQALLIALSVDSPVQPHNVINKR